MGSPEHNGVRILVVANRTAATPRLLEEVERRGQADWTPVTAVEAEREPMPMVGVGPGPLPGGG